MSLELVHFIFPSSMAKRRLEMSISVVNISWYPVTSKHKEHWFVRIKQNQVVVSHLGLFCQIAFPNFGTNGNLFCLIRRSLYCFPAGAW